MLKDGFGGVAGASEADVIHHQGGPVVYHKVPFDEAPATTANKRARASLGSDR